jgi:flagellar biosynthesis chaperone FliJ
MKRFSFRLEQVRKWRQNQTELEEMRLERLHNELHALEAAQREIATAAERSRRTVLAQSAVTAEELGSLESLHKYAKHELRRLKGQEQAAKARVAEQRQRVLEARRRFELLDGLHDKALAGWTAARDKEQEELGAELFLSKLARTSGSRT